MSAKLKGKEVRQVCSIRLEPKTKNQLLKKYGSLQAAIDSLVKLSLCKN
jgi:hypothetical protein